jgi:hypothetical protein
MYENLIGDVIIHAKGVPRARKAAIIQEYRSKKQVDKIRKPIAQSHKRRNRQ